MYTSLRKPTVKHGSTPFVSAFLVIACLAMITCGGDSPTQPKPPQPPTVQPPTVQPPTVQPVPSRIMITPSAANLTALGATVQLTASVLDQNGQAVTGATVTWQSSDTGVATVSGQGLVTAVGNGTAIITARSGSVSSPAIVSVVVEVISTRPDRDILISLYHSTDGPNWRKSTNWLSDAPLSDWHGVIVNDRDEVIELLLTSNRLKGPIPVELGQLENLFILNLGFNRLTGPIPAELGQLKNLITLDLSYNQLTGPIPVELGQLENLVLMQFRHNQLSGPIPAELGQLVNLGHLELTHNFLTGSIPVELGRLANLTTGLELSQNVLTGPIPVELGQLVNLSSLDLHNNRLTGTIPGHLGRLVNLTHLSLNYNQLTGTIPVELSRLERLTHLALDTTVCAPSSSKIQAWLSGIRTKQDVITCPSPEREVLVDLYHATGGMNWTNSTNWLSYEPLGDWYGVNTDADGNVTAINLASNEMNGSLPNQLGNLSKLKTLNLSFNPSVYGTLPNSFTRLAMDALVLDGTQLCAPPDDEFQRWLVGIPLRTVVDCTDARRDFYTLNSIYNSTNGPAWSNSENWLSGEPLDSWYGVRTNADGDVVSLELQKNNLSGPLPVELGQLEHLEELTLHSNRLTGPIPVELGQLERLEKLDLYFNRLSGPIPAELGRLESLEVLNLRGNFLPGPIPAELGQLRKLRLLLLRTNHLSGPIPAELGQLERLEELELLSNRLTESIPVELGQLERLEKLDLSYNQLTGPIPAELGRLKSLNLMNFRSNLLTGSIPVELGQLENLIELYLQENQLTGSIPVELGQLQRLLSMDLSSNQLTGPIPAELGRLEQLRLLRLSKNRLTGPIPAELGQIRYLHSLWLSFNVLTGNIPAPLYELAILRILDLTANYGVSGTLPKEITRLNLEELLLEGTRLCPPTDTEFQEWLLSIPNSRLSRCDAGVGGSAVYLTQATQSLEHPVPLVAGEEALLRVFITSLSEAEDNLPDVRATFYREGTEIYTVDIPGQGTPIPLHIDEGDLSASVNARVPGSIVVPGLEMVIEIDPERSLDPAVGIVDRLPPTGRLAVDVKEVPPMDLTLVPFLWTESPDRSLLTRTESLSAESDLFRYTRDLLPVSEFTLNVREPVWTSYEPSFANRDRVLRETAVVRFLDGGTGYYMGVIPGGGVAQSPGRVIAAGLYGKTIAHELGHTMELYHSPCGGAGTPDRNYPYDDGSVGNWGYDLRDEVLVNPLTADLMGYCEPVWISDYHYNKAFAYLMSQPAQSLAAYIPHQKSLLLWGGVNEYGALDLEPAFVVDASPSPPGMDGPYRITGEDGDGDVLFSFTFGMVENADSESSSFVFVLPVRSDWSHRMAHITVFGPEGTEMLEGQGESAAALLLDSATGTVRGILSDLPDYGDTGLAARRLLPEPGLEMIISRGVPDATDWDR